MIFWFYTSWAGESPVPRSLVTPGMKVQPERPPRHVGYSPQALHSGVSTGLASVPALRPHGWVLLCSQATARGGMAGGEGGHALALLGYADGRRLQLSWQRGWYQSATPPSPIHCWSWWAEVDMFYAWPAGGGVLWDVHRGHSEEWLSSPISEAPIVIKSHHIHVCQCVIWIS